MGKSWTENQGKRLGQSPLLLLFFQKLEKVHRSNCWSGEQPPPFQQKQHTSSLPPAAMGVSQALQILVAKSAVF